MITRSGLTIARTLGGDSKPLAGFELPDWPPGALCAETDADVFFPEKGGSTREAKRTCQMCTLREECLTRALENDEQHGIWGGMSAKERRMMRARARRESAA